MMYPYRVFISYSRDQKELAQRVRAHLERIGAKPMSDADIRKGAKFSDEIRHQISCAHVFVPILTSKSESRPWVHQEIGYAMGLKVPILPLALDRLPKGMAEQIQAVRVAPDLGDLAEQLTEKTLNDSVSQAKEAATAMYECANLLYDRTRLIVDYAQSVLKQTDGKGGRVRQRMAFSSFSIPNCSTKLPLWDQREGSEHRGEEVREKLLGERRIMEQHARLQGVSLILDPYVLTDRGRAGGKRTQLKYDREVTAARLGILKEFLEDMPDDKVTVAFQRGMIEAGLLMVGDWFVAEAVVPHYKTGYRQTIFTRHAPTVLARVEEFDREMEEILSNNPSPGVSSRVAAIDTIKNIIKTIRGT